MLHAAFVRSPHAHARVTARRRVGAPAGCVALLPEDVAGLGRYGCQARDQRVLADVARHAGDVVAAVAAPTRAAARAAAPAGRGRVRGAARRLRRGRRPSPRARRCCTPTPRSRRRRRSRSASARSPGTNVCHRFRLVSRRRRARLCAEADVVVERGVPHAERRARRRWSRTPPRRVGGRPADAVDRHPDAVQHARRPRRPVRPRRRSDVRVVAPPMGGSFGAKTFVRTEAVVAALARKAGRPVKAVLDRAEEFVTLNRHPATMRVRLGAPPRRHARRQGARLLGRHRRVRRLRPGRRDEAGLRRRRPVPDPARARRLARDLHEPPAQRRLPRLRRDAVGLGVRAGDGPARRAPRT